MVVKGLPNEVLCVNAHRNKVLVGMSDDDVFIAATFLEDLGLKLGEVGLTCFGLKLQKVAPSNFPILKGG